MKKVLILLTISLTTIFALPHLSPVYAQCGFLSFPGGQAISGPISKCDLTTIGGIVSAFLPAIFAIAGFIAIIMIIISGIQFMTSSGNPEAAAGARGRLTFALVGFALIVLSFIILQLVDQLFLGNVVT